MSTLEIIQTVEERFNYTEQLLNTLDSLTEEGQKHLFKIVNMSYLGLVALEHISKGTSPRATTNAERNKAKQVLKKYQRFSCFLKDFMEAMIREEKLS